MTSTAVLLPTLGFLLMVLILTMVLQFTLQGSPMGPWE